MDLKISKPRQCSLERSHTVLINLKNNSIRGLCLLDKKKSLGHLDTKICKTKLMKIFLTQFVQKDVMQTIKLKVLTCDRSLS